MSIINAECYPDLKSVKIIENVTPYKVFAKEPLPKSYRNGKTPTFRTIEW